MNAQAPTMAKPLRWPLVVQTSNRGESFLQDARLVNAYAEQDPNSGEYVIQQRIGYALDYTVATPYGIGNGMYTFGQLGQPSSVYSIFSSVFAGASMFKDGVLFGAAGGLPLLAQGQTYSFIEDQAAPPNQHLIFSAPAHVWWTTGASGYNVAATPNTAPIVPGLAYLDQTIYFMDNSGTIWGSNFNDPTTWNALNFVIANSIPGAPITLTQQLNYVLALKANSMEVFYDAANAEGSPLSPVAGALSNYGAIAGTAQTIDDVVLYVTSNRTVSPQVVRVDNLQISIISYPAIERLLDPYQLFYSWTFKHGGHRFYAITQPYTLTDRGASQTFTLVYDIDQKLWYQWTDVNGNFWPVISMAYTSENVHVLQGYSDGSVYSFDGCYTYDTDNGVAAPVEIYTPSADFGTRRRKTLHRMYFNADQVPAQLSISRSDDDYQTWSVPRMCNLNKKTPFIDSEGTFTKRAYHFKKQAATPFRIRSADLQMNFGVI
jgi:hypothetical protein